jgi:hypothetical protein
MPPLGNNFDLTMPEVPPRFVVSPLGVLLSRNAAMHHQEKLKQNPLRLP